MSSNATTRAGLWGLSIVVMTALCGLAVWFRTSVGLNDYFGIAFAADQLSLTDTATWRNGFYPLGSLLLVRSLGSHAILGLMLMNVALLGAGMIMIGVLAARSRLTASMVYSLALPVSPGIAVYVLVQTADIAASVCTLIAAASVLLVPRRTPGAEHSEERRPSSTIGFTVAAGLASAIAVQMRLHALLALLPMAMAGVLLHRTPPRQRAYGFMGAGAVLGGVVQVVVNLAAGYPPLHTSQAFNVYRTLSDVSWLHTSTLAIPAVGEMLASDPGAALRAWIQGGRWLWMPTLLSLVPSFMHRRLHPISAAVVMYHVGVALGGSERSALLAWPLALLAVMVALGADRESPDMAEASRFWWISRHAGVAVPLVLVVALAGLSVPTFVRTLEERSRTDAVCRDLESIVVSELGVSRSTQVFSDEYNLYLPTTQPHWVHHRGGWTRIDLHGFDEASPELCYETVECLHRTAARAGITTFVLGPRANQVGEALSALISQPMGYPDLFEPIGIQHRFLIVRVR